MAPVLALLLSAAPVVTGSLDKEVIRRVIHAKRAQVRTCLESAVAPDGKVEVKFVISSEGTVAAAEIIQDTAGAPAFSECIVASVKTWVFPKPKGGGVVVVTYPFTFHPAGAK